MVTAGGEREPVEKPPAGVFTIIKYQSAVGELPAYLTPDPRDGRKHPAIVWITGGDCNSIGDVWKQAPRQNDQTAAAYRRAGLVMMYPSLRGGNDNPGTKEGFLGEVDDVIAAARFLAQRPFVDPKRIYLGGHSTGGTLALLVAETTDMFRAVFSFGPIDDVSRYGAESGFLPFDMSDRKEVDLRSPINWLSSIQTPTWVIEGEGGNIVPLQMMERMSSNPKIHFIEIKNVDHFGTLAPTNDMIADKLAHDSSGVSGISLTEDEVNRLFTGR